MKSPFPGIDPWLEGSWGDVHTRLSVYCCDELQQRLPSDLRARIEEYVSVDVVEDESSNAPRLIAPEAPFVECRQRSVDLGSTPNVAVAEPVLIDDDFAESATTLRYIKIVDTKESNRVVTAIEFLSPANKTNRDGRGAFRNKQFALRQAQVNLVEIDLLRAGGWVLSGSFKKLPENLNAHYFAVVRRAESVQTEIYPMHLRARLPAIRIPLRPSDADVVLDLQKLIDMAYVNGSYGDDIDYRAAPVPPLSPEDQSWADEILKAANRR